MATDILNAFLDNEDKKNKMIPGQVRVVRNIEDGLTTSVFERLEFDNSTLKFLEDKASHFYFHWYLSKPAEAKKAQHIFNTFNENNESSKFDRLKTDLKKLINK